MPSASDETTVKTIQTKVNPTTSPIAYPRTKSIHQYVQMNDEPAGQEQMVSVQQQARRATPSKTRVARTPLTCKTHPCLVL